MSGNECCSFVRSLGGHFRDLCEVEGRLTVPTAQSLDHKGDERDALVATRLEVFGVLGLLHLFKRGAGGDARSLDV